MATILIGSARSDENGKYSGGQAGDQKQTSSTNDTSGEVSMQTMYKHSKGWLVFRPKAVSVATQNASEMKNACNNAHIGYDQGQRTTLWLYVIKNVIKSLVKVVSDVEVDCSELIRTIIYIVTGKDIGDITTANEAAALKKSGLFEEPFEYVSQEKTPVYDGDILVTKTKGHTAIVVSGNPRVTGSNNAGASVATSTTASLAYKVGDVVTFTGTKHYTSSSAATAKNCKSGKANVTAVSKGSKHPYHLVAVSGGGATVYGWVDEADISGVTTGAAASVAVGDKVKVTGTIYGNGNGTGGTIKKAGATMYVVDLVDSHTYKHYIGLASKKGGSRIGWAEPSILQKA